MTEREQDYSKWTPEELNGEFLRIFEMMPRDLPGAFYSGSDEQYKNALIDRNNSELKAIMSGRLNDLLSYSQITESCKKYLVVCYKSHFVFGLRGDESSEMLKFLLDSMKSNAGVFDRQEAEEIDIAAYILLEAEIDGLKVELNSGRARVQEVGTSIAEGLKAQKSWWWEYFEKYGEELSLPNEV